MKKATICLLCLAAVGILASAGLASAFRAGFVNEQQRTAINQAIENNDFETWKTAITETLTQENFDKLVARNKAMTERKELQDAVKQAIANGDYDAYKKAFENLKGSMEVMNEDDFNAMVERYKAGEAGGSVGGFGFPGIGLRGHHMPW